MHLMLDLETWSTRPHAVIISIGAIFFDPNGDTLGERFYAAIDPRSAPPGAHIDADTILWWMSPERTQAREAWLKEGKVTLDEALMGLSEWASAVAGDEAIRLWGNGAAFDNVLLSTAYKLLSLDPFWQHWNDRCYRTWKASAPEVKIQRSGLYHNALDDAVDQARHLQQIAKHLGVTI